MDDSNLAIGASRAMPDSAASAICAMTNAAMDGVASNAAMDTLLSNLDTTGRYGICGNSGIISNARGVNAKVIIGVVSNGAIGTSCAMVIAKSISNSKGVGVSSVLLAGSYVLKGAALGSICTATTSADKSNGVLVGSFLRVGSGVLHGDSVITEWKRVGVGGLVYTVAILALLFSAMFYVAAFTTGPSTDLANPNALHTNSGVALAFGLGKANICNFRNRLSCGDDRLALSNADRGVTSP